jgi:hypothetical protein
MKKSTLKMSMLCFLSTLLIGKSFGQTAPGDSAVLQNSIAQITSNFYKAIGEESRLYNGHEFLPYDPHIKTNALFPYDEKSWEPGKVTYDGIVYKNVPMMYDVYKDIVIVLLYNKFSMFNLVSNRVHDFSFSNHYFIRIDADQVNSEETGLTTGFYDQLYGGKIWILAKRKKTIQNSSNAVAAPETNFVENNEYYLRKGNTYYKIGSKGSVLKVLKDKKRELQQFLKQNSINYSDNPEDAMVKMASYYDHLTN